jgi:hypothetical protein
MIPGNDDTYNPIRLERVFDRNRRARTHYDELTMRFQGIKES